MNDEAAEQTLRAIVSLGRYAEAFAYDDENAMFSLENPAWEQLSDASTFVAIDARSLAMTKALAIARATCPDSERREGCRTPPGM